MREQLVEPRALVAGASGIGAFRIGALWIAALWITALAIAAVGIGAVGIGATRRERGRQTQRPSGREQRAALDGVSILG